MSAPRYWDGRVREVVDVRHIRLSGAGMTRIETLSCGHVMVPTLANNGHRRDPQFRVCWDCPGMETSP